MTMVQNNGVKRPQSSPELSILACDIRCKRHLPVIVDVEKRAKPSDRKKPIAASAHSSSPSMLYHMPADNLIHCPIVHIPGNKKVQSTVIGEPHRAEISSLQASNVTVPSAGDKHCDQSTAVSCQSHPRCDNNSFQHDVHGTAAPRSIKFPRRGAISVVHTDLDETETTSELKKEHSADKSDATHHPQYDKAFAATTPGKTKLCGVHYGASKPNDCNSISEREVNNFLSKFDWENT